MTNNEVVDILKYYMTNISDVGECTKDVEAFEEAIRCMELYDEMRIEAKLSKEAIRCVELVPELVEVLEEAVELLVDYDNSYFKEEVKKFRYLIKKAKGEE